MYVGGIIGGIFVFLAAYFVFDDSKNVFLNNEARNSIYLFWFFAFFLSAINIFSLSILIIKFLKPWREIIAASERIARDDYDFQLKEIAVNEEIKKIFFAYNKMLSQIKNNRLIVEKETRNETKRILLTQQLERKNLAMLNVLEDVEDEKKRAENFAEDLEKFKLAVDNASDHIIITDKDGIVLYANQAMEKITGISIKEAIGKKAGSLWGGLMDRKFYEKFWRVILKEKKIFLGEVKNKRKNGKIYYTKVSVSPILDHNKKVTFFVGTERDITQEKEIDIAKTEFVSLASHQLRTPLSTVSWYAEMLLSGDAGKLNNDQLSYLKEIYQGNKRMVELVNSLLNVSRIELGTFIVEPQTIDLTKLIEQSFNEFTVVIKKKKLSVSKHFQNNLPPAKVDPKLIKIIFDNLISNAVKYTMANGKISLDVKTDSKNFIINLRDSGIGIPKEQQQNIFTKLFRADNVRVIDTEGTGLGLYMVQSILNATDCSISVESEENKGTSVIVLIPLSGMKQKKGAKKLN